MSCAQTKLLASSTLMTETYNLFTVLCLPLSPPSPITPQVSHTREGLSLPVDSIRPARASESAGGGRWAPTRDLNELWGGWEVKKSNSSQSSKNKNEIVHSHSITTHFFAHVFFFPFNTTENRAPPFPREGILPSSPSGIETSPRLFSLVG